MLFFPFWKTWKKKVCSLIIGSWYLVLNFFISVAQSCLTHFPQIALMYLWLKVIERTSVILDPARQFLHRVWWRTSMPSFRAFLFFLSLVEASGLSFQTESQTWWNSELLRRFRSWSLGCWGESSSLKVRHLQSFCCAVHSHSVVSDSLQPHRL